MSMLGRRECQWMTRLPLWLPVLLLALATYVTVEISVTSDMGWYMNSGLNIAQGYGYSDIDQTPILHRAPGFPLMIAASYKILGISVFSAFWVVRLFAILSPLCLYLVGSALWGRTTGVIAALLSLSSYSINYWSYRHLDHVWPVFVLFSLLFLYLALERTKLWWFVASGIALAAAYLVKEVAVLFVPVPFLVVALTNRYRTRRRLLGAIISVLPVALVLILWGLYIHLQGGELGLILGQQGDMAVDQLQGLSSSGIVSGIFSVARSYFAGFANYFVHPDHEHSFFANFVLSPVFFLSWVVVIGASIRGDRRDRLLVLAVLCFSPVLARVGLKDMRLGQGMPFFLLTMLATARVIPVVVKTSLWKVGSLLQRKWIGRALTPCALVCVIGVLLGVQMFVGEKNNAAFLRNSAFLRVMLGESVEFSVSGVFGDPASQEAGEWIMRELPPGTRLAVSKLSEGKPIYFYSEGACPIHVLPVIQTNIMTGVSPRTGAVIFLSSWAAKVTPLNKFYVLTESDLLEMLAKDGIEYVIVSHHRNFLSVYFESNPGFSQVVAFGQGKVRVFKVNDPAPVSDFKPLVTFTAMRYLQRLKRDDPSEYERLVEDFFIGILGWSREVLESIESGLYTPVVREWAVY